MTRNEIIALAYDWLDTPFAHQGRGHAGVDCIGLVYRVGIDLRGESNNYVDDVTYGRDPQKALEIKIDQHLRRRPFREDNFAPGNILLFAFGRIAQHVGISLGNEFFIHSFEPEGKVVKTRFDRRWQKRLRGVFDYLNVED